GLNRMQPPPPMMRGPMFMDRRRLVGLMIILGLFLLLVGAMLTDLSRTRVAGTEPPEAIAARENLGLVWGPLAGHWGMFFLLTGLISRSMLAVVGSAGGMAALSLAASFLVGVGGFFVTLALFLGAYTADGESWTTTVWRIAQLLAAVLILIFVF